MVNPLEDPRPIYSIDSSDRLIFVNPAWLRFQQGDDPVPRQAGEFVGRSLWDVLPGQQVRQIWQILFERVRCARAPVFVPLRADTARERRLIDVQLQPGPDGAIEHTCEPVWNERREPVAVLDAHRPRDDRSLRCCSWCMRVQISMGLWQEVEDAERVLGIGPTGTVPVLEPSVCVTCKQGLLKTFPARVA
jgi:hypothetical protein